MKELVVQSITKKAKSFLYYNIEKQEYEIENYIIINKKDYKTKTYKEKETALAYKSFYRCTLVNNKINIEFNAEYFNAECFNDTEELPI